mgnify:CR=1 FL=1
MQIHPQTLQNCIEQSLKNDEKAFRTIVESYQNMVYTLAFRLVCHQEEAEDVVQETFIRVWLHLHRYRHDMKFSTWVYAIATNICLDKLKSKKYRFDLGKADFTMIDQLISEEKADDKLLSSEMAEIIQALTNELSPKQKVVFALRFFEDLEVEEIVKITGMSAAKIKSNLFLARKYIREKLERQ